MIKRFEFISNYANLNNNNYLKKLVLELEQYVDEQLLKVENIISMINNDSLNFNNTTEITVVKSTNAIHNNELVLDNGSGRSGGTDNSKYAIWSNLIVNPDHTPANNEPIINKTLDFTVDGELIIYLPKNTNKNAAKMLVNKYIGPSNLINLNNNKKNEYGFWGTIPLLNGTNTFNPDVIKLYWDSELKQFKMIFKLNI